MPGYQIQNTSTDINYMYFQSSSLPADPTGTIPRRQYCCHAYLQQHDCDSWEKAYQCSDLFLDLSTGFDTVDDSTLEGVFCGRFLPLGSTSLMSVVGLQRSTGETIPYPEIPLQ